MHRAQHPIAQRNAVALAILVCLATGAAACSSNSSASGTSSSTGSASSASSAGSTSSKYTVALSNSFIGNPWRKGMIAGWTSAAQQAQSEGLISGYKVETTPENTATAQIAQIDNLILEHVNAIDIDPASPTALNPVITKACNAGIAVVVFDSVATAPCEYNLYNSFADYGTDLAKGVANALNGKGNVIVAHGIVGTGSDTISTNASLAELKKFPGIKVVATINGGLSSHHAGCARRRPAQSGRGQRGHRPDGYGRRVRGVPGSQAPAPGRGVRLRRREPANLVEPAQDSAQLRGFGGPERPGSGQRRLLGIHRLAAEEDGERSEHPAQPDVPDPDDK